MPLLVETAGFEVLSLLAFYSPQPNRMSPCDPDYPEFDIFAEFCIGYTPRIRDANSLLLEVAGRALIGHSNQNLQSLPTIFFTHLLGR